MSLPPRPLRTGDNFNNDQHNGIYLAQQTNQPPPPPPSQMLGLLQQEDLNNLSASMSSSSSTSSNNQENGLAIQGQNGLSQEAASNLGTNEQQQQKRHMSGSQASTGAHIANLQAQDSNDQGDRRPKRSFAALEASSLSTMIGKGVGVINSSGGMNSISINGNSGLKNKSKSKSLASDHERGSPKSKQARLASLIEICGFRGDEWFIRKNPLRANASDEAREKTKAFFLRCTKAMASLIAGDSGDWLLEDLAKRSLPGRVAQCGDQCKAKQILLEVANHGSMSQQRLSKVLLCSAYDSKTCDNMKLVVNNEVKFPAKANLKTYTKYRKEFKEKVLCGEDLVSIRAHSCHVPEDKVQGCVRWITGKCTQKTDSKRRSRKLLGVNFEDMPQFLTTLSIRKAFADYKASCAAENAVGVGYPGFVEVWGKITVKRGAQSKAAPRNTSSNDSAIPSPPVVHSHANHMGITHPPGHQDQSDQHALDIMQQNQQQNQHHLQIIGHPEHPGNHHHHLHHHHHNQQQQQTPQQQEEQSAQHHHHPHHLELDQQAL